MAKFAHLSGNVVTNTIIADSLEDALLVTGGSCIEFDDASPAGIGMIYDETTKTFSWPVEAATEAPAEE